MLRSDFKRNDKNLFNKIIKTFINKMSIITNLSLLTSLFLLAHLITTVKNSSNKITLEFEVTGWKTLFKYSKNSMFESLTYEIYLIDEENGDTQLDLTDSSQFNVSSQSKNTITVLYNFNKKYTKLLLNFTCDLYSMKEFFQNSEATSIIFDDNFDFSKITTMENMFSDSEYLTNVYIGSVELSEVSSMSYMFANCIKLTTVDFSPSNTNQLSDVSCMFCNCYLLKSLDLSSLVFNYLYYMTKNANLENMFSCCYSLEYLNLSSLDIINSKQSKNVFYNCSSLKILDLSSYSLNTYSSILTSLISNNVSLSYCKFKSSSNSNDQSSNSISSYCDIIGYEECSCKDHQTQSYTCQISGTNYHYILDTTTNKTTQECYYFEGVDNYTYLTLEDIEKIQNLYKCSKTSTVDEKKCTECNNERNYYQKYEDINEEYFDCYTKDELPNYYLYNENNKVYLKICDISCKTCDNNEKCIKCNYTAKYFPLIDDQENTYKTCYNENNKPNGYYLNENELVYNKCHEDCATCKEGSNLNSTNCLTCNNQSKILVDGNCTEPPKEEIKCNNNKCKKCDEYSNENDLCLECNTDDGYKVTNEQNGYVDCEKEKPIETNLNQTYEELNMNTIYNFLYDYYINYYDNQSYVIQHKNNEYSITLYNIGIDNMNNSYLQNYENLGISKIDLGDCYQELIDYYGITKDLIYLQLEFESNQKDFNYLLYCPQTNTTLNLSLCNDQTITVTKNLNLNQSEIDLLIEAKEQGYNLLDIDDEFYTNLCTKYTSVNGTDVILSDRINDLYNFDALLNYESCDFDSFNTTDNTINCETTINTDFLNTNSSSVTKENVTSDSSSSSLLTMKCSEVFLSSQGLSSNFGSYWYLVCLFCILILMIYYLFQGTKSINYKLYNIITLRNFDENIVENNINKIKKNNPNSESERAKINNNNMKISKFKSVKSKDNSSNTNNLINSNDLIKEKKISTENTINISELTDKEINELNYDTALKYDKRTYCQYYWSLLCSKQFFLFMCSRDDNIPQVKIILFLYALCLCLTANELFFVGQTLSQIYLDGGTFNFVFQFPFIIYSTIIFSLVILGLKKLTLSENQIVKFRKYVKFEAKTKLDAENASKKILRRLKIKFFILCGIYLIFCGFWYYAGTFCAVYSNSQSHLIWNSLISFSFSMLYPFVLCLIPGCFRITALRDSNKNKRKMYRFSQILQMI